LPKAVVDALGLQQGDDIEIVVAGKRRFEVARDRSREMAFAENKAAATSVAERL
jgi:antitoxin component of MazEF toxin-antitoxin module